VEQLYAISDQGFRELEQVRLSPIMRSSAPSDCCQGCRYPSDYHPAGRELLAFVTRRAWACYQRVGAGAVHHRRD
jgi:hypothetical protein